jgi:hypothetical protein
VSKDRDGDLVMVAYDTSTWTRADTEGVRAPLGGGDGVGVPR